MLNAMPIYRLGNRVPTIDPSAFIHPDAVIIGEVTVGPHSTVWPGAVLRGDYGSIVVGERTSVQDGTVVHATAELPTLIGSECVVGHLAHLEGCVVEDNVLVGSGSILLHRVRVRRHAIVGANAVVSNDTEVPSYSMALGVPAKVFANRVAEGAIQPAVELYVQNGIRYRQELERIG